MERCTALAGEYLSTLRNFDEQSTTLSGPEDETFPPPYAPTNEKEKASLSTPTDTVPTTNNPLPGFDLDIFRGLIEHWTSSAKHHFSLHRYSDSELFLTRIISRSAEVYGPDWCEEESLKLLAIVLRQDKSSEIENLLNPEASLQQRCVVRENFELEYKKLDKWTRMETVLEDLYSKDCPTVYEKETLEMMYDISNFAFRTQDAQSKAEKWCLRAMHGITNTLGKKSEMFHVCVGLMIEIYEAKGDTVEADGYRKMLQSTPKLLYDSPGTTVNFFPGLFTD